MKNKSAIVIGWINTGKPADCGETMKNQLMIQKLEELGVHCYQVDFKGWKKHPWVFLYLLWCMIFHHNSSVIFSTSAVNSYPMMRIMKLLNWNCNSVHWVIGGKFGENVKNNVFDREVVKIIKHTLVESQIMVQQLEICGIKNVQQVPNFKPIKYYPNITDRLSRDLSIEPIRFVFLSRILPEKGCDYILEASELLNKQGFKQRYIVDFYGKIAESYESDFKHKVQHIENVSYCGFINLRENSGYDQLANYDVMLFPTYWKGEGFAGIFIDAYIAGLPIIASDWAHNRQFIKDGECGMFVPVHDVCALANKMKECILGEQNIKEMAVACQKTACNYNVDNVVTKELLTSIEIL